MTTTTSATSSTSTTATTASTTTTKTTAASATNSATTQLLNSLNAGSGVDTASLVTSLVTAQFDAKTTQLTNKADTLTAQISGIATLKNAVSTFATALDTLTKNGTLTSQPVSGNSAVFTASATGTGATSNLSASLTVSQLASAQVAVSKTAFASSTANVGTGQLTLTFGQATYSSDGTSMSGFTAGSGTPVTIDIADGSLTKIAAAINAKKAGVTASIVTDADGSAYLSLKSATGKDQAFTLSGSTTELSALNVGPGAAGSTITSVAQNAKMTLDGVSVERAGNTVSDLVDGVKLQLTGTSTTPVSLTSTVPTDALKSAVTDFVDTYNQVMAMVDEQLDAVDGPLKNDQAVLGLKTSLQSLTRKLLSSTSSTDGSPSTLAGIGVRTTKSGTLEVDDASLTRALKDYPDQIEAMFASTTDGSGIAAALKSVSLNAGSTLYGLGASNIRYLQQQKDLTAQQDRLTTQKTDATTRMTQQFSSMNSKVSAYKATQTFLTNQIAAWNKSDS